MLQVRSEGVYAERLCALRVDISVSLALLAPSQAHIISSKVLHYMRCRGPRYPNIMYILRRGSKYLKKEYLAQSILSIP